MAEVLEHGLLRTRRVCVCERVREVHFGASERARARARAGKKAKLPEQAREERGRGRGRDPRPVPCRSTSRHPYIVHIRRRSTTSNTSCMHISCRSTPRHHTCRIASQPTVPASPSIISCIGYDHTALDTIISLYRDNGALDTVIPHQHRASADNGDDGAMDTITPHPYYASQAHTHSRIQCIGYHHTASLLRVSPRGADLPHEQPLALAVGRGDII